MAAGVVSAQLTGAGFTVEQWSNEVFRVMPDRAVAANLIRSYMFPPGSKLHIPKFSSTSAFTITRGGGTEGDDVSGSFSTVSDTDIELTPKLAVAGYQIPRTTSNETRSALWNQEMLWSTATALAQQIDTDILDDYASFTTNTVDGTTGITWADLLEAVELLEKQNAPRDAAGLYYGIFHPQAYGELFNIAEVAGASVSSASGATGLPDMGSMAPLRTGANLQPLGVRIFFSANVALSTTYKNLVFSREAMGLAVMQQVRVETEVSLQKMSDFFVSSVDYANGVLHEQYGVLLTSDA